MSDHVPAFPLYGVTSVVQEGMSLRAYIATKCCAAMVSSIKDDAGYCRLRGIAMVRGLDSVSEFFAIESCKQADALIAELAK